MSEKIDIIEDAILLLLKSNDIIKNIRTVETYNGEIEDLVQSIKLYPAVYVNWMGYEKDSSANRSFVKSHRFSLIFATKNLRSGKEAARGDSSNVGAYTLGAEIEKSLEGKSVGNNFDVMICINCDALFLGKGKCVYQQIYIVKEYFEI